MNIAKPDPMAGGIRIKKITPTGYQPIRVNQERVNKVVKCKLVKYES